MKINILSLLMITLSSFSYAQNSKSFTYKENGNEYRLTVKSWETTTNYGHGLNIAFSVYKNEEFVHSADIADGRYVGCRYPFNGPGSTISIEQLKGFRGKKIGWLINGMLNACGASNMSQKQIFIIPFKDYYDKYYSFSINIPGDLSKSIITDTAKDTLSVWYHYEQWGEHAHSQNYYVPVKIDIIKKKYGLYIKKGNLMIGKENLKEDFVCLFNASIRDQNASLLQYALDNYFDSNDFEDYDLYKVPSNKKEIENIIQTIKDYNIIFAQFKEEFNQYEFEPVAKPDLFNK